MKRVIVVVNKWWECDPVLFVLLNNNARPNGFPWPSVIGSPRQRPDQNHLPVENRNPLPRAIFHFPRSSVELWCISDLLEHLPDKASFQSSSEQKCHVLPRVFAYGEHPDLVIAVGTAGLPTDQVTENGNVAVGTKAFLHNAHPNGSNKDSNWSVGPFDSVIPSALAPETFSAIAKIDWASVANRFLPVPYTQAVSNRSWAHYDNVALACVNVTDYSEYAATDKQTAECFHSRLPREKAASLETTHGLIRVQSDAPFLFLSGITDRLGHFDQEVNPRSHSQNTAAAHNAGVALAWTLPSVDLALE
jgi:hypothetical protein